jgi:hypothetical protein
MRWYGCNDRARSFVLLKKKNQCYRGDLLVDNDLSRNELFASSHQQTLVKIRGLTAAQHIGRNRIKFCGNLALALGKCNPIIEADWCMASRTRETRLYATVNNITLQAPSHPSLASVCSCPSVNEPTSVFIPVHFKASSQLPHFVARTHARARARGNSSLSKRCRYPPCVRLEANVSSPETASRIPN